MGRHESAHRLADFAPNRAISASARRGSSRWALASVVSLVVLGVLVAAGIGQFAPHRNVQRQADQIYRTIIGEQRNQRLDDGSRLVVTVSASRTPSERAVWLLQGEAHFDVVRNGVPAP